MMFQRLRKSYIPASMLLVMLLAFAVACGSAAETVDPTQPAAAPQTAPQQQSASAPSQPSQAVAPQPEPTTTRALGTIATPVPQVYTAEVPEWVSIGADHHYNGVIRFVHRANPGFLDLHYGASSTTVLLPSGPRFNQLLQYDPTNPTELIGDLADTWEVADDGLTLTFHLAEANWQDGVPVTADDVVFSLDRMAQKGVTRGRVTAIRDFYEPGTARAVDDRTVEMPLLFPSATALGWLGVDYYKIYARHIVESKTQDELNCCFENNVGSGPWMFKEWKKGDSWEMERFDGYFKNPIPFYDGFKAFVIEDAARRLASMKAGQVDAWMVMGGTTLADMLQVQRETGGKMRAVRSGPGVIHCFYFHWDKQPLDDHRVRKAIYLAIDRSEFAEVAGGGEGILGNFFPPGYASSEEELLQLPGFRYEDGVKHPDDLAEAKRLLSEAGFPDGLKINANVDQAEKSKTEAKLIAAQLKDTLNIDVELQVFDRATFYANLRDGSHNISVIGTFLFFLDPQAIVVQFLAKDSLRNPHNWEHPRITELMALESRELDPEARRGHYRAMEEILNRGEGHFVPLYWEAQSGAVDYRIQNFKPPYHPHTIWRWDQIWWDEKATPAGGDAEPTPPPPPRPPPAISTDRAVLVALYNATDGPNWRNDTNWLSDRPLRAWHGVTTDNNGRVTRLELRGNRLSGEIPASLGSLSNLKTLDLSGNRLSGEIPASLGSLSNLAGLDLNVNELTGNIPAELGELNNLEELHLEYNDLTGEIPPELGNPINLKILHLQENDLSGPVPEELGYPPNVWEILLRGNGLTGCIPAGLKGVLSNDFEELGLDFCEDAPPLPRINFADGYWESVQLQNRIAGYIVETGYGYPVSFVHGASAVLVEGLRRGDIDVSMEVWLPNQSAAWEEALAAGEAVTLGQSLGLVWESAFVIPAYLQEQYPGLASGEDLKDSQYKALFATSETGGKARLVSCVVEWSCESDNRAQVEGYGLRDHVHVVNPVSGTALNQSLSDAYEKRDPWLGYQWAVNETALLLDLVALEEPAYSDECWETTKACGYEGNTVWVGANADLSTKASDVVGFLEQWDFSVGTHLKDVTRWQDDNPTASMEDSALYWLRNNVDTWSGWVTADAATMIREALATPPGPPQIATAEPGPDRITVRWDPPVVDGLSPITAYDLRYITPGLADVVVPDVWESGAGSTEFTLAGLLGNTAYSLQVRAINGIGAGGWSPTVTVTTWLPVAPGMPTGLTAGVSATSAVVDLSWTVPETDGGSPITGYRIESSPDGNGPWTEVITTADAATSYTDDGTDANGPVFSVGNWPHYRVAAINRVGSGPFSDPRPAGDSLVARYDDNANGTIEKIEVIKAINDYLFEERDEAISKAEVIRLINLYLFG